MSAFRSLLEMLTSKQPLTVKTLIVVLHLRFGQAAQSGGCRKPTEIIQNPSERKTAEALFTESRASVPGCPLRRGDSKRAEFTAELMVPMFNTLSGNEAGSTVNAQQNNTVQQILLFLSDSLYCKALYAVDACADRLMARIAVFGRADWRAESACADIRLHGQRRGRAGGILGI